MRRQQITRLFWETAWRIRWFLQDAIHPVRFFRYRKENRWWDGYWTGYDLGRHRGLDEGRQEGIVQGKQYALKDGLEVTAAELGLEGSDDDLPVTSLYEHRDLGGL